MLKNTCTSFVQLKMLFVLLFYLLFSLGHGHELYPCNDTNILTCLTCTGSSQEECLANAAFEACRISDNQESYVCHEKKKINARGDIVKYELGCKGIASCCENMWTQQGECSKQGMCGDSEFTCERCLYGCHNQTFKCCTLEQDLQDLTTIGCCNRTHDVTTALPLGSPTTDTQCQSTNTPDAYSYIDVVDINENSAIAFIFKVKACGDVHVAFYGTPENEDRYEIVIGGWSNSKSVIRRQKQGSNLFTANGAYLSCTEFRYFWVLYLKGEIQVGVGQVVGNDLFMLYDDPNPHPGVNKTGITTGFGSSGEWCYNFTELSEALCQIENTPTDYVYIDIVDIAEGNAVAFMFKVKACGDVHVGFYATSPDDDMYEIVIGGWGNSKSVIRRQKQGSNLFTDNAARLSCEEFQDFWISYWNGEIQVGEGEIVGNDIFMWYDDPNPLPGINRTGITTGFGNSGDWCYILTELDTPACHLENTPDAYSYTDIIDIDESSAIAFLFRVKACGDVHVGLYATSPNENAEAPMYEIVIGGWGNTQSVIRREKQGPHLFKDNAVRLSCDEFRDFWVSYSNGDIQVGEGQIVGKDDFMWYGDLDPHNGITTIGITTGFGSSGVWCYSLTDQDTVPCQPKTSPDSYFYTDIVDIDTNTATVFMFEVKACSDVHVGLYAASPNDNDTAAMYEIVIGGWTNTLSIIRRQKQGSHLFTDNAARLSCTEFQGFWISYWNGQIHVGEGPVEGNNVFMWYDDPIPLPGINTIGITTGFGASGEWCFSIPVYHVVC